MDFEVNFYLVAIIVVIMTGISKSGFGAGLEMLAVPILSLFILPMTAAAIMLPILVMIDLANLWRYRKVWVRSLVFSLLPAATIGIAVGTAAFTYLDPNWVKLGLGILALLFLLQLVLGRKIDQPLRPLDWPLKIFLAAVGGLTSFVAHAGGPPTKIILLSENLEKQQYVGTNSYLFAGINFLKLFPYFWLGQFSTANLSFSFYMFPFVCLGIGLGFWLNGVISQIWFTRVVLVGLLVAGIKLTFDGIIGMV